MSKNYKIVLPNFILEITIAFILIVLILFSGNFLGKLFPKQIPSIDSVAINMFLPKGSNIDVKQLSKKTGLAEMLIVYSLSAIDSSQERVFSPKDDITLFFSIADALPTEGRVKMFRFKDSNILEMDYIGNEESAKIFCNKLGLTGKFSTVYYTPVNNTNTYTIYAMIMGD